MEENEKKKIDWKDLKDKIDEVAKLITNLVILVQVPAIGLFLILTYYLIRNGAMPPSGLDMFVSYLMLVLVIIFFFLFCLPALMIPVILKKRFNWNPEEIQLGEKGISIPWKKNFIKTGEYFKVFWKEFISIRGIKNFIDGIFVLGLIILLLYEIYSYGSQVLISGTIFHLFIFYILFQFQLIFSRSGLIVSIITHFLIFFSLLHFNLQFSPLFAGVLSFIVFIYLILLSGIALIRIVGGNPYIVIRDLAIAGVLLILSLVYIFNGTIIPGTLRMLNLASANEKVIYLDEKLKDLYGCGECVEVVWRSKEQIVLRKEKKVWIVPGDKVSFENCQDNKSGGVK